MILKNRFANIFSGLCSVILIITFFIGISGFRLSLIQSVASIIGVLLLCVLIFKSISCLFAGGELDGSHAEGFSVNAGKLIIFCCLWVVLINVLLFFVSSGKYPVNSEYLQQVLGQGFIFYESLAANWYTPELLGLFPLYSIMVNLFNFFGNFTLTAIICSSICAIISGITLYYFTLLDFEHEQALRAVRYFYIIPSALFLIMPLPESMLMMFSLLFFYFLRKKFYINAFMSGFCAALCGFSAVFLIIPAMIEVFLDYRESASPKLQYDAQAYSMLESSSCITVAELSALYEISQERVPFYQKTFFRSLFVIGVPLGFLIYMAINFLYGGNFLYFIQQNPFSPFATTPAYIMQNMQDYSISQPHLIKALSIPNLIWFFTVPIILLIGVGKIRSSVLIYALILYILEFTSPGMQTAFQRVCILFPLAQIISSRTNERTTDIACSILCVLAFAGYFINFIMQIYM